MSAYDLLPNEDNVPALAGMKAVAATQPARESRITTDAAVELAFHETGSGRSDRTLVLVHGVMSDSRVWRFMSAGLAERHDVVAIDLPGCGQSDRPDPAEVGAAAYGPSALARSILLALRHRLAGRSTPVRLTLIGHSLGGTIILRMFADNSVRREFSDVLGQVDSLVLFTPADVFVDPNQPTFRAVAELTDLAIAVAGPLGLIRKTVAESSRFVADSPVTREEVDRTTEILSDRSRRRAAQAMLRQSAPFDAIGRLDVQRATQISAGYIHVAPPCLIAWGDADDVLPQSMGYKLACEIPDSRLRIVVGGTHCMPVERPGTCVKLVEDFLATRAGSRPWIATVDGATGDIVRLGVTAVSADPRRGTMERGIDQSLP
jgi:pimeloyl-ACP methyl ester carboxylesterase